MNNEVIVNLNDVTKIKNFSHICSAFTSDIDIASIYDPKYIVDAKSVMGVFGLDLSRKAVVKINSDDEIELVEFRCAMQEFSA